MVYFLCLQVPFTGGEDGIQGVPRGRCSRPDPTENDYGMYYVVLAIFLFGYFAICRIVHSPFGKILKAIRDNERARCRWATRPTATSCWPSCCRPRSRASPAAPRRSSSSSRP